MLKSILFIRTLGLSLNNMDTPHINIVKSHQMSVVGGCLLMEQNTLSLVPRLRSDGLVSVISTGYFPSDLVLCGNM